MADDIMQVFYKFYSDPFYGFLIRVFSVSFFVASLFMIYFHFKNRGGRK